MSTGFPLAFDLSMSSSKVLSTAPRAEPDLHVSVIVPRTGPDVAHRDHQLREMLGVGVYTPAAVKDPSPEVRLRLVAPGLLLTEDEYQVRFGSLPIEQYRDKMSPKAFAAYIRFVGIVKGGPKLDMVRLSDVVEDQR